MIEVFKITHDLYDPDVSLNLAYHSGTITRGNKYKHSLPNHVVDVNSVNVFKARLQVLDGPRCKI